MAVAPSITTRPSIAAALALQGQVGNAARAAFAPQTLGPSLLRTPTDILLGEKEKDEKPGIMRTLMSVITNPLFLAGIILHWKFPIATGPNALRIRETAVNWQKKLGPVLDRISPLQDRYPKALADQFDNMIFKVGTGKDADAHALADAMATYRKSAGLAAHAPLPRPTMYRVASALERVWEPGPMGISSKEFGLSRPLVSPAVEAAWQKAYPAEHKLMQDIHRNVLEPMRIATYGHSPRELARMALLKKGVAAGEAEAVLSEAMGYQSVRAKLARAGVKVDLKGSPDRLGRELAEMEVGKYIPMAEKRRLAKEVAEHGFTMAEGPIKNYWPHMARMTPQDYEDAIAAMLQRSGADPATLGSMAEQAAMMRLAPSGRARAGSMVPNMQQLREAWGDVGGKNYLDPAAVEELAAKTAGKPAAIRAAVASRGPRLEARIKRIQAGKEPYGGWHPGDRTLMRALRQGDITLGEAKIQAQVEQFEEELKRMNVGVRDRKWRVESFRNELTAGRVDDAFEMLDEAMAARGPGTAARQYSLDVEPVLTRYSHTMNVQKVWLSEGEGKKIIALSKQIADPRRAQDFSQVYLPQLMGRTTMRQSIQNMEWAEKRIRMLAGLKDPKGLSKLVPKSARDWIVKRLESTEGTPGFGSVAGGLTSWFYTSTLGLNAASAIKNLLQTVLTTGPIIGFSNTFKGITVSADRVKKYIKLREQGLGPDEAFGGAFKEFLQARLDPSPIVDRLFRNMDEMYSAARTGGSGKVGEIQKRMLSLFQGSERFNRLTAFYGGLSFGAKAHGIGYEQALKSVVTAGGSLTEHAKMAVDTVRMTQFPAGPGQTPMILENVPRLFRQFLQFPMRFAQFLGSSTLRGEAGPDWLGGRNLGTIGRTLAVSTAGIEIGREMLDTDLSSGLLWGALPLPVSEDMPFYPFPIVPPAISLMGAAGQGLMTGDIEPIKRAVPLLVPGGVALSRARRFISPEFADYGNRTEDGRIPLFSQNQALIGNFTPMQLIGRSLGFGTMTAVKERELTEYLIKQRDEIRALRREYLEALAQNDMKSVRTIQEEWRKRFPSLGELQVHERDIEAIKIRRRITRLERVLDTLPQDMRPQFAEIIASTLGAETEMLMGVDSSLLTAPKTTFRTRRNTLMRRQATTGAGFNPHTPPSTGAAPLLQPPGQGFSLSGFTGF